MKSKPPKKRNRRSRSKYPALDPSLNLKTRYELIETDYLHLLTEKEKAWLNSFNEEYVNANFNHKGKKIHKKREHRLESYGRNNSRNRDILTRAKAMNRAYDYNSIPEDQFVDNLSEEIIIEKIDGENALKNPKDLKKPTDDGNKD